MAVIKLTQFEQYVASYVPFLGEAIDFKREQEIQKALVQLYDETDGITVLLVKFIVAELWWASHIGSAASDARGYSEQIQKALSKADDDILAAWTDWLKSKYPADLRALYDELETSRKAGNSNLRKLIKADLKPLEAEIAALEKWKKITVTPDLKQWITFYGTWKKTYLPPLRTLIDWLKTPSTFAKWAILPLISVMPSSLRTKHAAAHATAIESALLATWTKDPDTVYTYVLDWLVST